MLSSGISIKKRKLKKNFKKFYSKQTKIFTLNRSQSSLAIQATSNSNSKLPIITSTSRITNSAATTLTCLSRLYLSQTTTPTITPTTAIITTTPATLT
jgi:hypothetical protein